MLKRNCLFILLLLMGLGLASCSSTDHSEETAAETPQDSAAEEVSDAAEDTSSVEEDVAEEDLTEEESGEEELAEEELGEEEINDEFAEENSQGEEDLEDELDQQEKSKVADQASQEALEDELGLDKQASEEQGAEEFATQENEFSNLETQEDTGAPKRVQNVEYKANDGGGTIVITTDQAVQYTTRQNAEDGQFVIELQNTNLPKRFHRPYNTKEFNGAIGLFQGYQNPGVTSARFVIQIENDGQPLVQQEGNQLLIVASSGGEALGENVGEEASVGTASEDVAFDESGEPEMPTEENVVPEPSMAENSDVLKSKTLQEYLTGNNQFYGKKINIEVKDWDVRDVFDFIAEQSGLNLVLAEEVKGTISLKLKEIPWDQALIIVMQSKQLGYVRQGKVLRIAPLQTLRTESEQARQVMEAQNRIQPLEVKIIPISYAKATDLEVQVKEFLSPVRGKVKADDRTNSLVVTDVAKVIEKIGKLVDELDRQTPQVLIEAKIIEARESFQKDLGVNWAADAARPMPMNTVNNRNTAIGTNGVGIPGKTSASGINFIFGNVDFAGQLTATLNLLEEESIVKVISSPRIIGLNKKESVIEQTTEIPIKKQSGVGDDITVTTEYRPVTLELKVTPQITAEGGIVMDLQLKREFVGSLESDGNRRLFKRSAKTTLLVNNGETAVIGGIYQSDSTKGTVAVPWLHRIPVLGWLFKTESDDVEKNELMMFISPRVLNVDDAFSSDDLQDSSSEQEFIDDV